jgi:hypothetical protein
MKNALSFFAGAALIAAAVIWGGGRPAGMFVAGALLATITIGAGVRIAGFSRAGRFLLAFDEALSRSNARRESPRAVTPGRREKDTTPRNANVLSFQKTEVLNTTQQQVVSALHNLGMPMTNAQKIVVEASQGKPGIDFDSLFRACLPSRTASA